MNRRRFLTVCGMTAATAAVAPKVLAEPITVTSEWIVPNPVSHRLVAIIPNELQIPSEAFKFHEYLQEQMERECGAKDLLAFHKMKGNHHGQRTAK